MSASQKLSRSSSASMFKTTKSGVAKRSSSAKKSLVDVAAAAVVCLQKDQNSSTKSDPKSEPVSTAAAHDFPNIVDDAILEKLRAFDLNGKYGPCDGLTRLRRWQRAEKFGLEPPAELLPILDADDTNTDVTQSLWYGRL
ncbi:DNA polymerase delta, subunit 4-domain-containing protein [Cladochytrium replicatum]|nr:DNA polymerase delta, subunit 4-domain-containing protein [Cladochytrium replicatum]